MRVQRRGGTRPSYITLRPGDVLWMGTDAVVDMKPGTTLSVTVTGIGTLSNPVEQEEPPPAAEEQPAEEQR
ncbi:fumarylacetoacetate hydrolase family protein [Pseudofrankia sp. BMG5.36]|uniref:fumarylacetoacetate hydrolase family protein n=1 Tax=Pseudofrankia sp. BMG5.36 TaxID=1834512 RepID=UPI0009F3EA8F